MSNDTILYSYYRSSASYRARIGLNLKAVDYVIEPVHLLNDGGEQHKEEYLKLNPMRQVPCLVHSGNTIAQSLAILMYADDVFSGDKLFPEDPTSKAKAIQLCEIINSGMQPLQNLSVIQELKTNYGFDGEQAKAWIGHWVNRGFKALENLLDQETHRFAVGDTPSVVDAFIVPQVFSGNRFGVRPEGYPNIHRIYQTCMELEAFQKAAPENQPDAPEE